MPLIVTETRWLRWASLTCLTHRSARSAKRQETPNFSRSPPVQKKSTAVILTPEPLDILTPEEVAALLRVQPSFIYEKCRRRSRDPLPVHRIGRYLRFSRREVLAWF